jgi:hypothetical protein
MLGERNRKTESGCECVDVLLWFVFHKLIQLEWLAGLVVGNDPLELLPVHVGYVEHNSLIRQDAELLP